MMGARRTLSRRLTVFYTAVGAITLGTAGIALVFVAFAILTRPEAIKLAQAANGVAAAAATASARETTLDLQHRIIRTEGRSGVRLIAIPADAMREGPTKRPPGEFSVATLFGLNGQFISVRDAAIFIIPERAEADGFLRNFLAIVFAVAVCSVVLAWLIARIVTRKALAPLLTVTAELQRFARGDFAQRPLAVSDATELGDLASAYNGAARQVTEAFLERARVEDQIRAFVAEAGHELRTPLTVVAGYIDGLRRGGAENDAYRRTAFDSVGNELRRMRALVERLMTLARLDSRTATRPEVVDVGATVSQAVDALSVTSDVPILVCKESDLFVLGEPGDVYEAVANLLENALKYGGRLPISVAVASDAGNVTVRVADGGPGIADADRVRIFERFYRGDQTHSVAGSGLGLPIAAKAAERLGGRLVLEDARAGSTTFTLFMPVFAAVGPEWAVDLEPLGRAR